MENLTINIADNESTRHFEMAEYPHHYNDRCKYKVFEKGVYVASFTQGDHHYLNVCQNPGNLNGRVLDQLAEQIDAAIQHPASRHLA